MDEITTKTALVATWHITTWLMISLALLNLADFGTTYYAMAYMGVEEANPVLAYLIELTGTTWVILWFKITTFAFFFTLYAGSQEFHEKFQKPLLMWTVAAVTVMYTILVASNFSIIFRDVPLLPF